jgi:5-methylthioadenosine/S-adenosylhomocysteine deaminase
MTDPAKRNTGLTAGNPSFRVDARWIITMNQNDDVLENHSLIVADGRIADILSWNDAAIKYPNLPAQNRREAIVMPGLINAHTHLAMNLLRGFADDKPLQTWLEKHIWPAEAKYMSAEFVRDGTELALAESLLSGVTTFNDMYFFADATAEACESAGVRATIGLLVIDFPSAWASTTDEYFQKALALHDQYKDHVIINTAFAPHAPYSVSTASLERIAVLSSELQLPVHIHVQETAGEIERYQQTHGVRPVKALSDIGLITPDLLAVHLTHVSSEDITHLADGGANAVHCPESNLKLASGISPVIDMHQAGINIAIGTDSAASNNDLDLLGECRTAALLAKAQSQDAAVMAAARVLRMVTIDAATALGISDVTGSLQRGKAADCITIEPDLGMMPVYDAMSSVLFTHATSRVRDVWVNGRQLVRDRSLQTIDIQDLQNRVDLWEKKIQADRL